MRNLARIISLVLAFTLVSFQFYTYNYSSSSVYILNGKITDSPEYGQLDDFQEIVWDVDGYSRIYDYSKGYSIAFPGHMWIDVSLSAVKTVITDSETDIEVYYDDFHDTVHYAAGYIYYGNKFLQNREDHSLKKDETVYINGYKTHILIWEREKLSKVHNDKNYYVSAEIIKNNKEIYTVIIKSTKPIENYKKIFNSFKSIEQRGKANINTVFKYKEKAYNEETEEFYNNYFLNSDNLRWGIYEPSAPVYMDDLRAIEEKIDYNFDFVVRYHTFNEELPFNDLMNAYNDNKYVELTLQTMYTNKDNSSITYEILEGKYDDYFERYAQKLKEFGHPVLFRLNNEMNGDWCVYSSYYSSKDPQLYKSLWRYIYSIFEKNGVDNVLWVWNPHDISFPDFKWNHYLNYYPGDDYVDIIGLTGYNTGTYYTGEKWRDFGPIYDDLYEEYMNIFDYPFMITEFGANSIGGDKAIWITDMFDNISKYNNIKVAIWFNGIDYDSLGKPARIYRFDDTEDNIKAFREGISRFK